MCPCSWQQYSQQPGYGNSLNVRANKENVVCLYNGLLLGREKKEILPSAITRAHLERTMLSEVSQSEEDKFCMPSLTRRIYK